MTCTHDPATLTATVLLIAGACFALVCACSLGLRLADRLWRRLTRAEDATRVRL